MTTLKEKAYRELRHLILSGQIKPGEFLTERDLVKKLEMSRTPIRSAIDRLEVEGFINNFPNKGPVVAELSIKKVIDIYDVRISLESHVVKKLAIKKLSDTDIKWFDQNLEEQHICLKNNNYIKFSELDANFHNYLVLLHNNEEIIQIFNQIQSRLQLLALKVFKTDAADLKVYYDDHVEVFKYLKEGEGEKAANKITTHLEFGKGILIS